MGAAGNGATGFAAPLASGDYTVWIQELGGVTRNYRFDFVVTPVPKPSSVALMLAGLAMLTGAALRRRPS